MTRQSTTSLLFATLLSLVAVAHAADSPYAGQEKRAIKALSEQEISDYLNGRGMGTSKAAELNHYPGPKHVLDEAARLGLSPDQSAKTAAIYRVMSSAATRIGKEIVQKEAALEALYAEKQANAENTSRAITELATLQADYRLVHLNAHLDMRQILSAEQIALYDRLRGYDSAQPVQHQHH